MNQFYFCPNRAQDLCLGAKSCWFTARLDLLEIFQCKKSLCQRSGQRVIALECCKTAGEDIEKLTRPYPAVLRRFTFKPKHKTPAYFPRPSVVREGEKQVPPSLRARRRPGGPDHTARVLLCVFFMFVIQRNMHMVCSGNCSLSPHT